MLFIFRLPLYCRLAYFAKGSGDAYLFDMQCPNVPESVTRTHISVSKQTTYIVEVVVDFTSLIFT